VANTDIDPGDTFNVEVYTRIRLGYHIFVAEKGDNDEITNGLPQNEY
jgi:hypothetical protein